MKSLPISTTTRLRWIFLSAFVIIGLLLFYIEILHESCHLALCFLSGNEGKITFGIPPMVECPGILQSSLPVYFLYNMAPYIFLALPIVSIFALFTFKTENYYLALFLFFLPLLATMDTFDNFFQVLAPQNDFYNLLFVNKGLFILSLICVIPIFAISVFWADKYWKQLKKTYARKTKRERIS